MSRRMISHGIVLPALFLASSLHAQTIRGRLLERDTKDPVPGGDVVLVDGVGDTLATGVSGDDGSFVLESPEPGQVQLRARRLGYAPAVTDYFLLQRRILEIDVLLTAAAVELDPVTVTVRSRWKAELRQLGRRFIDRAAIEEVVGRSRHVGEIIRWQNIPGLNVRETYTHGMETGVCIESGRRPRRSPDELCNMVTVYVDDVYVGSPEIALQALNPNDVDAIAFLRGHEASTRYGRRSSNGVLLIYTRGYIP